MMGGMGNMGKMMKNIQKMQEEMGRMEEELAHKTVEATAGGGAVKVVATGKGQVVRVEIQPEAVDPQELEMLQDLIVAAVNEALRMAQALSSEEMRRITQNLPLPKLPGLF